MFVCWGISTCCLLMSQFWMLNFEHVDSEMLCHLPIYASFLYVEIWSCILNWPIDASFLIVDIWPVYFEIWSCVFWAFLFAALFVFQFLNFVCWDMRLFWSCVFWICLLILPFKMTCLLSLLFESCVQIVSRLW